jgi:release factor glutamine methyltransferase
MALRQYICIVLVQSLYHQFRKQLMDIYPANEAASITNLCFAKLAGLQKISFIRNPELTASPSIVLALNQAIKQLLQYRPVQYVLGEAVFAHLTLIVNEHVLIPRPETEELAAWMVADLKDLAAQGILDVGTGSGCLPIYLHSQMPHHQYYALDVSEDALAVARQNALLQQATIHFIQADILTQTKLPTINQVDVIVSNPPYIPQNEMEEMDKHVTAFEPHLALFVPNNNPLLFYEAIVQFAKENLHLNGQLYLETHWQYAAAVGELCSQFFEEVMVKEDLFGKPRMVKASRYRLQ